MQRGSFASPASRILFAAAFLLSGCSLPVTPTPYNVPTMLPANIVCNELSFYLDPALGNGIECESVPESSGSDIPMDIFTFPAHTVITIQNYPLDHTQFPPQVIIYPVDRFRDLLPEVLSRRLSDLENIISGGTWNGGELPFLPPLPMMQSFFSHETVISFDNGQGIRFLTDYNESNHPISNKTIFYTFQGLSEDRKYWVAVTLPISSPILPAAVDFPPPPEGYTAESWFQNYTSYVEDLKEAIEAQPPDSFHPTIDHLDSLVKSITIR